VSTTEIGRAAEARVADFLLAQGYTIFARNWRTRYCEIDIVAGRERVIYFIEVKSRKSDKFGGGMDYITFKKLKQMAFAARIFVSCHNWSGPYRLAAAGVTAGKIVFIDNIS